MKKCFFVLFLVVSAQVYSIEMKAADWKSFDFSAKLNFLLGYSYGSAFQKGADEAAVRKYITNPNGMPDYTLDLVYNPPASIIDMLKRMDTYCSLPENANQPIGWCIWAVAGSQTTQPDSH